MSDSGEREKLLVLLVVVVASDWESERWRERKEAEGDLTKVECRAPSH